MNAVGLFVGLSVIVILIELLKGGSCLILLSVPISFVYVAGYLICTSGLPWPLCGSLVGVLMYSVPYLADFVHHVVLFTEYHCHYMF